MGSLSFVMCFSKFIIQQSILYVILFYKKLVKWCITSLKAGHTSYAETEVLL